MKTVHLEVAQIEALKILVHKAIAAAPKDGCQKDEIDILSTTLGALTEVRLTGLELDEVANPIALQSVRGVAGKDLTVEQANADRLKP